MANEALVTRGERINNICIYDICDVRIYDVRIYDVHIYNVHIYNVLDLDAQTCLTFP